MLRHVFAVAALFVAHGCAALFPTSQPTSAGIIGRDWFLTVSTEAQLWGTAALVTAATADRMPQAVAAAFLFALKETMPATDRTGIVEVAVTTLGAGTCTTATCANNNDTLATAFARLYVTVWCNTTAAGAPVAAALDALPTEPLRLLLPLHERGWSAVTSFTLTPAAIARTTQHPPAVAAPAAPATLSPFRIVWIILGAVGGFTLAVCVLGSSVSFCRRHPKFADEVSFFPLLLSFPFKIPMWEQTSF